MTFLWEEEKHAYASVRGVPGTIRLQLLALSGNKVTVQKRKEQAMVPWPVIPALEELRQEDSLEF